MAQIPHTPQLASPTDGTEVAIMTPTLIWYDVSGAASFGLEVSTDSTFASTVFSDSTITDSLRTVGPLTPGSTYFWRVNASNPGQTSQWSEVWTFTVSTPTLIIPSTPPPRIFPSKRTATYNLLGRVVAGNTESVRRSLTNGCYLRRNGDRINKTTIVH
ncbi:MAG: hypothetical protein JXA03_09155 [Bacteroidales bacterium]|nr:hypothetical protein [Bacteroidales bacterium]